MKNKYQEALDYLRRIGGDGYYKKQREKNFDVLQELLDKETPMKKTIKNGRPYCAKCSYSLLIEDVWEMSYCCACGQKIDWRNENIKD